MTLEMVVIILSSPEPSSASIAQMWQTTLVEIHHRHRKISLVVTQMQIFSSLFPVTQLHCTSNSKNSI